MNEAIIFFLGAMGGGMVVPRSFACSWSTGKGSRRAAMRRAPPENM